MKTTHKLRKKEDFLAILVLKRESNFTLKVAAGSENFYLKLIEWAL